MRYDDEDTSSASAKVRINYYLKVLESGKNDLKEFQRIDSNFYFGKSDFCDFVIEMFEVLETSLKEYYQIANDFSNLEGLDKIYFPIDWIIDHKQGRDFFYWYDFDSGDLPDYREADFKNFFISFLINFSEALFCKKNFSAFHEESKSITQSYINRLYTKVDPNEIFFFPDFKNSGKLKKTTIFTYTRSSYYGLEPDEFYSGISTSVKNIAIFKAIKTKEDYHFFKEEESFKAKYPSAHKKGKYKGKTGEYTYIIFEQKILDYSFFEKKYVHPHRKNIDLMMFLSIAFNCYIRELHSSITSD